MMILSIDTSCDETAVAVTDERHILANKIYSQILIHKKWGGVVPSLAKRAHEERIDTVISEAVQGSGIGDIANVDYIAVTQGPGLAVALEVGIRKAKELAKRFGKKVIVVNHMEGHIYSCFAQNSNGNPKRDFVFPFLAFLISGGHTELVIMNDHLSYEIIGETIDDACGEALDKAAKMLGLGYPGGAVIERLAKTGDKKAYLFPRPLYRSKDINFSFSGLKTAFYYALKKMPKETIINNLNNLAASFQEAVFDSLFNKLEQAMKKTSINRIIVAGGVVANTYLRAKIRKLVKTYGGTVFFPPFATLCGDNAAMIGIAAYYKTQKGLFIDDLDRLDRVPRLRLSF
ncbi:MAG TPA: tRNA (adenosine(37)-N6)-threonylcarbamoyltransferase complex transferase subunit TsaD [Patescibacteria group bacterium]|nr:tRNA (adenosine(37)-N6)-threonylcarbamoyltransferase complex transferase subunit TsaD [Patescibacteria group bacterium]